MRCEAPHCTNVALREVLDGDVVVHACTECAPTIETGIAERDERLSAERAKLRGRILAAVPPLDVMTEGALRRDLGDPAGLLAELRALIATGELERVQHVQSGVLAVRLPSAPVPASVARSFAALADAVEPVAVLVAPVDTDTAPTTGAPTTPTQEAVVAKPKRKKKLTEEAVVEALEAGLGTMGRLVDHLGYSDGTVRRVLRELDEKGRVVAKGKTSTRMYHLVEPTAGTPEAFDAKVAKLARKPEAQVRRPALADGVATHIENRRIRLAELKQERDEHRLRVELLTREEWLLNEEIEALESLLEECA